MASNPGPMKIFLSYASEQQAAAESIQLGLVESGHEVFFDRESLAAGAHYLTRIAAEVQACDLLLFLVSPESVATGRYTLSELDLARRKWPHPSGHLLPVLVAPTPMASIPPYLLAVTLLKPRGNLVADIVHAVQFDIGAAQPLGTRPDARSPDADTTAHRPRKPPWALAAVLALAVPALVFGSALALVRFDLVRAEILNVAPPLGMVAAALAVVWVWMRGRS